MGNSLRHFVAEKAGYIGKSHRLARGFLWRSASGEHNFHNFAAMHMAIVFASPRWPCRAVGPAQGPNIGN